MPDAIFAHPRLAAVYDDVDYDRSDLDHYEAIIDEFDACSVLDIGCGTGSLAVRLAERGIDVTGLDPAGASLDVARTKAHAERVRWILGDASALPHISIDMAIMTGNVAQVFVTDSEWNSILAAAQRSVVPCGHLVFETRDPAARAWDHWTRASSFLTVDTTEGPVDAWVEVTEVRLPLVSFVSTHRFARDETVLTSTSTLRFRSRAEIDASLDAHGFDVVEVRDAPDRPGKEWVYVAQRRRNAHSSIE